MTEPSGGDDDTLLSPKDMKLWLKVEIKGAQLATARRIEEAKTLVEDYASGRLDREEANRRLKEHEDKWGRGVNDSSVGWDIRDHAFEEVQRQRRAKQTKSNPKQR